MLAAVVVVGVGVRRGALAGEGLGAREFLSGVCDMASRHACYSPHSPLPLAIPPLRDHASPVSLCCCLSLRVDRADLTTPAKVFNSPLWSYDPGPALQVLPLTHAIAAMRFYLLQPASCGAATRACHQAGTGWPCQRNELPACAPAGIHGAGRRQQPRRAGAAGTPVPAASPGDVEGFGVAGTDLKHTPLWGG